MKLVYLFIAIAVSIALPFLVIGEIAVDQASLESYGHWAWLIAILCLIGDLFLALPASAIITAMGSLYGPLLGGLIGGIGSFLAGLLGYGLARLLPDWTIRKLLGKDEIWAQRFLDQWGIWAIACSRFLPILPEALCIIAGLTRMTFLRFTIALLAGSMTMGFTFASLPLITDSHVAALVISIVVPVLLTLILRPFLFKSASDK